MKLHLFAFSGSGKSVPPGFTPIRWHFALQHWGWSEAVFVVLFSYIAVMAPKKAAVAAAEPPSPEAPLEEKQEKKTGLSIKLGIDYT